MGCCRRTAVSERLTKFWGNPYDACVVDKLGAPDVLVHYPMHGPREGRGTFPDLNFWAVGDLIAEGDCVVGRWDGSGTHTGPAFSDLPVGSLPAASGKKIRFTGTTVFRIQGGKIAEEIGEEGALAVLQQLDLAPMK